MAELKFYGANCFEIKTKEVTVLIDPLKSEYGKPVSTKDKVVVLSDPSSYKDQDFKDAKFVINTPGEYEISKVSIHGMSAKRHIDDEDAQDASIIYRVTADDNNVGILGNIAPKLTDEQLETLGIVDYLLLPVGGKGLTLDAISATNLIREIEPKVVVPSHFASSKIEYPMPQDDLDIFSKEMSKEAQKEPKLKLNRATLPEDTQIVELEVS